jgi:hypothetical protein
VILSYLCYPIFIGNDMDIILYRAVSQSNWEIPVLKVNPSLIFNGAISGFVGARGRAGGGYFDDFSSLGDLLLMGTSPPCLITSYL